MKLRDIRRTPLSNILEDLFLKTDALFFCIALFVISHLLIAGGFWYANILFSSTSSSGPFINNFLQWDSIWYLGIADQGYGHATSLYIKQPFAFFPLYPLMIHTLSTLTGWPTAISGIVLSNLFFLVALFYLHRLLQDIHCNLFITRFTMLLLALSPANIYFTSVYTESLFLALSIMSISFAYRGQWFYASVAAAFLSATRPNGICIILPLLLILAKEYRNTQQFKFSYYSILLAPVGLFCYMWYLNSITGDPLIFYHNQVAWNREGWTLNHLWVQFRDQYLHPSYSIPAEILFILSLIMLYRRKYYIEMVVMIAFMLPAFSSGLSTAFSRFAEALYPFYLGLALLVANKKYYPSLLVILFSLLLGINIMGWTMSAWLI